MCDRCADLQEEVTELRRQLAYEVDKEAALRLASGLGLTNHEAVIVSALVRAKGRTLSIGVLSDLLPEIATGGRAGDGIVAVLIVRIRAKLGRDSIENLRGVGYRASPSLMAKCVPANEDAA